MTVDWNIVIQIATPIIALFIGAILRNMLESREKLISYLGHVSTFRVNPTDPTQQPYSVNTHSVIIKNTGRKAATNVRLGHAVLPNMMVYPDVEYRLNQLPGGGSEILFPSIVPRKEITVSYLYFPPITWDQINTHIESDRGPAKVVNVLLQPQIKPWQIRTVWFFIICGIIGCLYSLIEAVLWLAK